MGFPVPQGTFQGFCQDVSCSILVSVQHQPTRILFIVDLKKMGKSAGRGTVGKD